MFFGATSSIIRGVRTPVLFSLISGLQWFGISSVFYGILSPPPGPAGQDVIMVTFHYRYKKGSDSKVWPGT